MGFLHAGHASLLRRARALGDRVVLSIFVNPLQFGPREDLSAYPRDLRRDLGVARREGVDLVYVPRVEAMIPPGFRTRVEVEGFSGRLCGAYRPGHFDGVCTIVLKLVHQVEPDVLLLGQKDAQQALILHHDARPRSRTAPVVCPTVREPDGLAMSSRNSYLTAAGGSGSGHRRAPRRWRRRSRRAADGGGPSRHPRPPGTRPAPARVRGWLTPPTWLSVIASRETIAWLPTSGNSSSTT
jgi:pantoate--beta-alanine ligase